MPEGLRTSRGWPGRPDSGKTQRPTIIQATARPKTNKPPNAQNTTGRRNGQRAVCSRGRRWLEFGRKPGGGNRAVGCRSWGSVVGYLDLQCSRVREIAGGAELSSGEPPIGIRRARPEKNNRPWPTPSITRPSGWERNCVLLPPYTVPGQRRPRARLGRTGKHGPAAAPGPGKEPRFAAGATIRTDTRSPGYTRPAAVRRRNENPLSKDRLPGIFRIPRDGWRRHANGG